MKNPSHVKICATDRRQELITGERGLGFRPREGEPSAAQPLRTHAQACAKSGLEGHGRPLSRNDARPRYSPRTPIIPRIAPLRGSMIFLARSCRAAACCMWRMSSLTFWERAGNGTWEPETLGALERLIRPRDAVLDIGAWVGPTTRSSSASLGAQVLAVEADPRAQALLALNVSAECRLGLDGHRLRGQPPPCPGSGAVGAASLATA